MEKRQEARQAKEGRNWAAGNSKGLGTHVFRPKDLSTVLPCRQPWRGADFEHFENKTKSREFRFCKAQLWFETPSEAWDTRRT